ncbi:aminoglycoside phosphotransferase family protein [Phototrophicus methaneseepsis]|uniref:Aminoglycoside phosphotransferase family protein n=1 Tax=Phototrophicus methaneseepsis TaxID=2710758 RepID=A0A7S8EAX5_9CHLR|nr:aminoglycoside phosphotransferase family protein [Phototrophicus methaneseepsis]QPC83600.1 aminoglycoside phosphotransferase family protein [Phototrophicus methaneseepsis]
MSIRPQLEETALHRLLKRHFVMVTRLQPLSLGQTAQVYRLDADGRGYILRISTASIVDRFRKERFVGERFGAAMLPVPAIIHIGEYEGFEYAISIEAAGHALEIIPREAVHPFIPAIMAISDAMCRADVAHTQGYGWFDPEGNGSSDHWADHFLHLTHEDPPDSFYGSWHSLFQTTFLEEDVFQRFLAVMMALLEYCPDERYLVHGNFSLPNLIGQQGHITGVVDWADARFGDFLYDVASLALWYPMLSFPEHFRAHYQHLGLTVSHFEQRLLCYQLYIGLDALRFFAKIGDEKMYRWVKARMDSLL